MWAEWWIWVVAALALAILEMLAPAYVFLGFAIGAAAMGVMVLVGGPVAGLVAGSLPLALLVFALISAAAWIALRSALGSPRGEARTFDHDINED